MAPSGSHGRVDVVKRLSQCEIFVNADQSIVSRLVELGSVEFYGPKQIVRYRGDVCNEVLFLVDGETLGLFTNNEGRVLQIDHMLAPKLLASAVIFAQDARYPVDIETVKKSIFLSVDRGKFLDLLMSDRRLLENYLRYISNTFLFLTDRFYEIAMKNLVQKVCSYLFELSRKQNSLLVQLDMSKEEMAREFNVTRPALSRVFIELEKLGIIVMQGRKVEIKNLKYLEDYTSFG